MAETRTASPPLQGLFRDVLRTAAGLATAYLISKGFPEGAAKDVTATGTVMISGALAWFGKQARDRGWWIGKVI